MYNQRPKILITELIRAVHVYNPSTDRLQEPKHSYKMGPTQNWKLAQTRCGLFLTESVVLQHELCPRRTTSCLNIQKADTPASIFAVPSGSALRRVFGVIGPPVSAQGLFFSSKTEHHENIYKSISQGCQGPRMKADVESAVTQRPRMKADVESATPLP